MQNWAIHSRLDRVSLHVLQFFAHYKNGLDFSSFGHKGKVKPIAL